MGEKEGGFNVDSSLDGMVPSEAPFLFLGYLIPAALGRGDIGEGTAS